MYEEVINLDEVVTAFVQSGAEARWKGEPVNDLFSFLLQYHFHREVDEKERTTFFCQIVSLYETNWKSGTSSDSTINMNTLKYIHSENYGFKYTNTR